MKPAHVRIAACVLVLGLGLVWYFRGKPSPAVSAAVSPSSSGATPGVDGGNVSDSSAVREGHRRPSTIHEELRKVQAVFESWQMNFPGLGNPVGTNAEITAVLCGTNAFKLELISREHARINARGELCDEWGTPFRFHQLSGTVMEIISAGPDRDFATADDVKAP